MLPTLTLLRVCERNTIRQRQVREAFRPNLAFATISFVVAQTFFKRLSDFHSYAESSESFECGLAQPIEHKRD